MELSQEVIDRYVGGQLEVQYQQGGYLYRGEITSLDLTRDGQRFNVRFKWLAKMGYNFEWEVIELRQYSIDLKIYVVSDIGGGRISLNSLIMGEMIVLFPSHDGSKLDPSKVRGLVLNA